MRAGLFFFVWSLWALPVFTSEHQHLKTFHRAISDVHVASKLGITCRRIQQEEMGAPSGQHCYCVIVLLAVQH